MITDTELRKLRPKEKAFKVADRDGMYVTISTAGTKSFRYDYRLNGRRETLTIAQPRSKSCSGGVQRKRQEFSADQLCGSLQSDPARCE